MDLKVYDFKTGVVSFSRNPVPVHGIEQLTQYIAKLLIQLPGSNLYSPEGGEGIFESDIDLNIISQYVMQNVATYIESQDSSASSLPDDVKLGLLTNIEMGANGKIDVEVYSLKQMKEGLV